MPPQPILNYKQFNYDKPQFNLDEVRNVNPQRHEFEQLSGVVWVVPEELSIIGYKDLTEDEFWVKGHMPGYPLLPGVLICEAAAQTAGFMARKYDILKAGDYIGFGGMDKVRFRMPVYAPCRLIICVKGTRVRPKVLAEFDFQAYVNDQLVANGQIIGVPIARGQSVSRQRDA